MTERDDRYNHSPKGKARAKRYDDERRAGGDVRPAGPRHRVEDNARRLAHSHTPEYRLAKKWGVKVAVARDILAKKDEDPAGDSGV